MFCGAGKGVLWEEKCRRDALCFEESVDEESKEELFGGEEISKFNGTEHSAESKHDICLLISSFTHMRR